MSLSGLPSGLIHVVLRVRISFLWLNNSRLSVFHLLTDPWGCFYVLAVVRSAALHMDVQMSRRDPAFISFG